MSAVGPARWGMRSGDTGRSPVSKSIFPLRSTPTFLIFVIKELFLMEQPIFPFRPFLIFPAIAIRMRLHIDLFLGLGRLHL